MHIAIDKIQEQLFANTAARHRITRDFGLQGQFSNASEFASAVVASLDQAPAPVPWDQAPTNRQVFRAAVRALGSNSRSWGVFLTSLPTLTELLHGFDPVATHQSAQSGRLTMDEVKACLPGQSSTGDARAILQWAERLATGAPYGDFMRALTAAFRRLGAQSCGGSVAESHLMLCVAAYIGNPPPRWIGNRYLGSNEFGTVGRHKAPGMGYALASEFLRNLGWSGFKPDRHVMRLFNAWMPGEMANVMPGVNALASVIGSRNRQLVDYLGYSLLGATVTPPGIPLSVADNHVWLLGAYVEKAGRESRESYLAA
jgi:hypothetical protein